MTIAPMTARVEPIISYLSGFFLSTILPPKAPSAIVFFSLSHSHTRYPPPISIVAAVKKSISVTGDAYVTSSATRLLSPLLFLVYRK